MEEVIKMFTDEISPLFTMPWDSLTSQERKLIKDIMAYWLDKQNAKSF